MDVRIAYSKHSKKGFLNFYLCCWHNTAHRRKLDAIAQLNPFVKKGRSALRLLYEKKNKQRHLISIRRPYVLYHPKRQLLRFREQFHLQYVLRQLKTPFFEVTQNLFCRL